MTRSKAARRSLGVLGIALAAACTGREASQAPARAAGYDDLVALFGEWRAFQQPRLVDGVPDYGQAAMGAQHRDLATRRARLAAIDHESWPVERQVDYYLVRAEMNGLDFDHRVLRPWANNPAFYVTVFPDESDQPAREGPHAYGAVELWRYARPLSSADAETVTEGLGAVPALLQQARTNLVGIGRDLWIHGTTSVRQQASDLDRLASDVAGAPPELADAIARARDATVSFAGWLDAELPGRNGPSGVGRAHYEWYMTNVLLVPFSWAEQVAVMERELARAVASLALEESRNAALPPQTVVASAEEHASRFNAAVDEYVAFLRDRRVLNVADYMEPALRARLGTFTAGRREFFTEVDYRDPVVMRTHGYHWFDKARMQQSPHPSPIRKGPLLYNIFTSRTEGLATGWEEMMLQAGMFDGRPRSRELIYVLLAQRAARALGDLRMHANEWTLEQAAESTAALTPRGWLRLDGPLVRGEQHLYLQQPGYGTSYVIGKIQIERLLAGRKRRAGDAFQLSAFMEELDAAGLIPMSLIEWQLSGEPPTDVRRMLATDPEAF